MMSDTLHCRTLTKLQLLSHQLTPVMHSCRQQLIDQAQHAATAVANSETVQEASVDENNAQSAAPHGISSTAQDAPAYVPSAAAAAAVSAFAFPSADPAPDSVSSPFANSEAAVSPFLPVRGAEIQGRRREISGSPPVRAIERQGRRREISGSLPLEQMFSRLPSPVGSAGLDRAYSDGAAPQPSGRHTSRAGFSLDLTQIVPPRPMPAPESVADRNAGQRSQERWSLDSFQQRMMGGRASRLGSIDSFKDELALAHSQLPATTPVPNHQPQGSGENQTDDMAAALGSPGQAEAFEPLTTVYSGEGLLLAPQSVGQYSPQLTPDKASPPPSREGNLVSKLSPAGSSEAASPCSSLAGEADAGSSNSSSSRPSLQRGGSSTPADQGAVALGGTAVAHSSEPVDSDMLVAHLEAEAEARMKEQQRQHPWLLYFYDQEMERGYSRYHAQQMVMVRE